MNPRHAAWCACEARCTRALLLAALLGPQPIQPTCHKAYCRAVILHDPDCVAAANKALARRFTAAALWGVGAAVAVVTAVVSAVAIHKRQLTAAGFVVWNRHFGEGGEAAGDEYGQLVDAAEVPGSPTATLPAAAPQPQVAEP